MLSFALAACVVPAATSPAVVVFPPGARAAVACVTTVPPMLYSEVVAEAQQIVIGSASATVSRLADGGKTIRTFVTLDRLTWIKGKPEPTLTLQLEGGKVGETRLQVPDMPQLKVGARYLLYVAYNGTNLSPIVGFHQGIFEILAQDSREVLVGHAGRELIGISGDRFVFAGKPLPADPARVPPPAVAVPGFTPRLAGPDAAKRQDAERAWIAEHDRANAERPLPELPSPVANAAPAAPPGREPKAPPEPSQGARQPGEKGADKSPITVPPDQDRGARISVQTLLDSVHIEGRR